MGREPKTYAIWAGILQVGPQKHLVTVRATAVDDAGPEATFVERAECATREEAKVTQFEKVREITARLTAQGHSVADVNTAQ